VAHHRWLAFHGALRMMRRNGVGRKPSAGDRPLPATRFDPCEVRQSSTQLASIVGRLVPSPDDEPEVRRILGRIAIEEVRARYLCSRAVFWLVTSMELAVHARATALFRLPTHPDRQRCAHLRWCFRFSFRVWRAAGGGVHPPPA
jgi:hypothetical protein